MRLIISCVIVLTIIIPVTPAESRGGASFGKCYVPKVKEALEFATAVFSGKVVSVKTSDDGRVKTFEFKVERYWKGPIRKKVKVGAYESTRYQAWFKVGKRYLVYANGDENGKLWERRCSASKQVGEAGKDLAFLGPGKIPKK